MGKKNIKFDNTETEKYKFYQHKHPFMIDNININKIIVPNNVSFDKKGLKYFIGYKDSKNIGPACVFLPNMGTCRRDFDKTKCMSFFIKDEKLLEKCNEIWKKVSDIIRKEFDSKLFIQ